VKFNTHQLKVWLVDNGVIMAVIVLAVVFTAINPRFISPSNILTILMSIVELALIALPLSLLIMSGSIDLSIGSIATVGAVTFGMVTLSTGSLIIGMAAAIGFGIIAGGLNGFFVSFMGLNPIVITLGFLAIWGGFALFLTGGKTVYGLPESSAALNSFTVAGVRIQLIVLLLAIIIFWIALNRLPIGKKILAIGGSERVAFLIGIPFKRIRFFLFVLTAVLATFSGILLTLKLNASPPNVGSGMELRALTVVLLGGVAFAGGIGRISGVVAGLFFVGILSNGLVIVGVNEFLQTMALGVALVIAVTLDGTVRRIITNSWTNSLAKDQVNAGPLPSDSTSSDKNNRSIP
jgi:ribose/xylose/arabinose/galactoside ABC-type transport system permease subunit